MKEKQTGYVMKGIDCGNSLFLSLFIIIASIPLFILFVVPILIIIFSLIFL